MVGPGGAPDVPGATRAVGARDAVIGRLVEDLRHFPRMEIAAIWPGSAPDREIRQARALHHEVVRRLMTLEWIVDSQLKGAFGELEVRLRAVLLVGAAQILFFEHIPDHAAVDESVNWAKSHIRPGAGKLVNAVLRKVAGLRGSIVDGADWISKPVVPLSDGRFLSLNTDVLPEDLSQRLAVVTSHPVEAIRRWVKARSFEWARHVSFHSLVHAPTILKFRGDCREAGAVGVVPEGCTPHALGGYAVYEGPAADLGAFLAREPGWRVQDPGSAAAIEGARKFMGEPELIIDLCAGSGTKTSQLLDVFPDARIVACDPDRRRFSMLCERFGDEARVRLMHGEEMIELAGTADCVLADVPCSNSGTLARRIEAKYRLDQNHLDSLVKLQRQVLIDALRLRKAGSVIVYSTCSLEPMENERQGAWMARYNDVGTMVSAGQDPAGQPGDGSCTYRDGGYFAVWR